MKPHAFIISLGRETKRREHAINEAKKAGLQWEIIEAVDARAFKDTDGNMDWDALRRVQEWDNSNWGCTFKASEIAIYASHLNAMRRMLNLGLDWAYIFEDDFQLREAPYTLADVAHELNLTSERWSHCCLHGECQHFNREYRVMGPFEEFKTLNRVRQTTLINVAYAVSSHYAEYFLSEHTIMRSPVDHRMCADSADPCELFLQTSFPVCGSAGFPSTNV